MQTTATSKSQSPGYLRWHAATEWPLIALAVVFATAYSWKILAQPDDAWRNTLDLVILLCWIGFAVDYLVRLALTRNRLRWFGRNILLLAVVALPVLRPLRLIRVFSVFGIFQRSAAKLRGQVVVYVICSTALLVYIGSLAVYDAERDAEGATITSFGRAVWWAVETITTVGYGDFTPVTPEGRFVATGLMIAGIALLSTVTATVASWLVASVSQREEADERAVAAAAHTQIQDLSRQVGQLSQLVSELTAVHSAGGRPAARPEAG